MHRLTGLDAGYLAMDAPNRPMHSTHVVLLRGDRPLTLDDLARHLERRLAALPSFRRRAVPVPLGLHHPVWIEDPDFDLRSHLLSYTLPDPGGMTELDVLLSRLNEKPLELTKPLWRAGIIEGLADGRSVFFFSLHHAIADGRAIYGVVNELFRPDAEVGTEPDSWRPDPMPTRRRLVADAVRDHRQLWPGLPALARSTYRNSRALEVRRQHATFDVPGAKDVRPISLNDPSATGRRFVRVTMPLADFRTIRRATGVTMNDVFLAVLAGGMRSYLAGRGELPDGPLVISNTALAEAPDSPDRSHGNHMGSISAALPVHEPDPMRRLELVAAGMVEAKAQFQILGPAMLEDWMAFAVPALVDPATTVIEWIKTRRRRGAPAPPGFNLVASNIRGPSERFRFGDYVVDEGFFCGIATPGPGAMFIFFSHAEDAVMPIVACADALPDPDVLVAAMHAARIELLETVERVTCNG